MGSLGDEEVEHVREQVGGEARHLEALGRQPEERASHVGDAQRHVVHLVVVRAAMVSAGASIVSTATAVW